jgi:DNA polymerase III subunit epsilon
MSETGKRPPRTGGIAGLKLERPLAFFDIESTGISPRADRIIDLSIIKLMPDGTRPARTFRVNPGIPIPPETTAIHGITDEDVKDAPAFEEVAQEVAREFAGCDLAGYNILRFDIPMLVEELTRAGVPTDLAERRIVDVQRIFHQREPRDLEAALAFYCQELHLDAHSAEADVLATIRVLEGQFRRYKDLPGDVAELDAYCNRRDPAWVDRTGKLKWQDGEVTLNFGKRKGERLRDIVRNDAGFAKWMLRSDFPQDTRAIVSDMLDGRMPTAPTN